MTSRSIFLLFLAAAAARGRCAVGLLSIPPSASARTALYDRLEPTPQRCHVVVPSFGSSVVEWRDWQGDELACVKECTYDSACMGALYSRVAGVCVKAARVELRDSPALFKRHAAERWVYYVRKTRTLPYLNGRCASYYRPQCKKDRACGWNRGKPGYNQRALDRMIHGGYCGRVRCGAGAKAKRRRRRKS